MKPAILLTGRPGVGKTSLLKSVINHLKTPAGGFYTEDIRESGVRTGFSIVTLDGRRARLASKTASGEQPAVGSYVIHVPAIDDVAVPSLISAAAAGQLVVADEIGPMEVLSTHFIDVVRQLVAAPAVALFGTIALRSFPIGDELKRNSRVHLVEVTRENRDELVDIIARALLGRGTAI